MATPSDPNGELGDLLSQFKCMGTTDRDMLIEDLFVILDRQIPKDQCAFILEMASWNLQNAVGAFYDYLGSSHHDIFKMRLEGGVLEPQGPILTGTRFSMTWVVVNTGQTSWTDNVRLVYHSGHYFSGILEGPIGRVQSGERKMITTCIIAPPVPGVYRTQMRLSYEGDYFGDVLPIEMEAVEAAGVASLTEQLSSMTTSSIPVHNKDCTGLEETLKEVVTLSSEHEDNHMSSTTLVNSDSLLNRNHNSVEHFNAQMAKDDLTYHMCMDS